jgi:hypothetical protein
MLVLYCAMIISYIVHLQRIIMIGRRELSFLTHLKSGGVASVLSAAIASNKLIAF